MVHLLMPVLITTTQSIYGWNAMYAASNVEEMEKSAFLALEVKSAEKCKDRAYDTLGKPDYSYYYKGAHYVDHAFTSSDAGADMRFFFLLALISNSALAGIYCKGDENLRLNLDVERKTFSFMQFCWNPCNTGEGELVYGPRRGWAGIMYALDLTRSHELISPMKTRKMMLLLDHDGITGTLSDGTGKMNVTCRREDE